MRQTIFKYTFEIRDITTIVMPEGAKVLSVHQQYEVPTLWALVDLDAPQIDHRFLIFGTGMGIPPEIGPSAHVATFQMGGGTLVWHMFDAGDG